MNVVVAGCNLLAHFVFSPIFFVALFFSADGNEKGWLAGRQAV